MIQISSLWSLNEVEDFYYINEKQEVFNRKTGQVKRATKSKQRGYWYYTLQKKDKTSIKVYLHKIIALAFIENRPYELIEHIDDNKDNNSINNLRFSNKRNNTLSAFKNNKIQRTEKNIKAINKEGRESTGPLSKVAEELNVPKSSLYFTLLNNKTKGRKIEYVEEIKQTGQQTIEKIADA